MILKQKLAVYTMLTQQCIYRRMTRGKKSSSIQAVVRCHALEYAQKQNFPEKYPTETLKVTLRVTLRVVVEYINGTYSSFLR